MTQSEIPAANEGEPTRSETPPDPRAHEVAFVNAMTAAGLLTEMSADELDHDESPAPEDETEEQARVRRYLDLLDRYYQAGGDTNVGLRRRMTDRFFVHRSSDPVTATQLIVRLSLLTPEIGKLEIEQIGNDGEGDFVLRAGEHIGGIVDDEEEDGGQANGMLTIRALIRAVNVLLGRHDVRHRFVPLRSDGTREAFVATTVTGALNLCQADYLEEPDVEALIEFGSW